MIQLGSIGQISYIRIDSQIRTVDKLNIIHGFFHCIHKRCFHSFKAQDYAFFRRHAYRRAQIPDKFAASLI